MTDKEAIEVLTSNVVENPELMYEALDMAIKALEQQLKTGHWEWIQYDSNLIIGNWHCSECRTIIPHMPEELDGTPIYKWCPMCGAKIAESEDKQ